MSKPILIITCSSQHELAVIRDSLNKSAKDISASIHDEYWIACVLKDDLLPTPRFQMFNSEGELSPKQAEALEDLKKQL